MDPLLVGFGGYAFAGKDTAASFLSDDSWYKTYMSKNLRQALYTLNPLIPIYPLAQGNSQYERYADLEDRLGYETAKKYDEVRLLLQRLGTEVGRKMFGDNFWIDLAMAECEDQLEQGMNVTITGIRYPNELKALHDHGGLSIWIERPGFEPVNAHTSENSLSRFDFYYMLLNDSTPEKLGENLHRLLGR